MKTLILEGQPFLFGQGSAAFLITHSSWPLSGRGTTIAEAVHHLHQAMIDAVRQPSPDADPEMMAFILSFLDRV